MSVEDPFLSYLDDGFDQIEDWPGLKKSVRFLEVFRGVVGGSSGTSGACEIGVHHGKYLIALHNLFGGWKRSLGIDLFEDQGKNVDGSGIGSREICQANIDRYAANPHMVELLGRDSLTLNYREVADIARRFDPFSIVSVDGGHSALHLTRDFLFASECVSGSGIIVVDDFFHPHWPGVTEGFYSVVSSRLSPFVPFFMTRKKVFCCSASVQVQYRKVVREYSPQKEVEICGWKVSSLDFGNEY